MKINICVEVGIEEVESLVQELENTSDDVLRGFIEHVLFKLNEHTAAIREHYEAFEKVNPFSLSKLK